MAILLKTYVMLLVLIWAKSYIYAQNTPQVVQGILKAKDWNFEQSGSLKLSGNWEFYRGKFIAPNVDFSAHQNTRGWGEIPGNWRYEKDGKSYGSTGIATYRATFYFKNLPEKMAIHVQRITSAYELYINGLKVGEHGKIAHKMDDYQGKALSRYFQFSPTSDTLTIVVHVANFELRNGGIERAFRLGTHWDIQRFYEREIAWDLFLVGAFLMTGLYHFFLVLVLRRDMANLWFALASILIAIRTLVVQNYYLEGLFPSTTIRLMITLSHLTISLPLLVFTMYMFLIFRRCVSKRVARIIILICLFHVVFVMLTPPLIFENYLTHLQLFLIASMAYFGYVLVISRKKYPREFFIFIISFLILFATVVNDVLHANQVIQTANLISFGMLVFIFSQSAMLSLRFADAFIRVRRLSEELQNTNKELEMKVLERTKKLSESHEELNRMLETSQAQKLEIESKNNNITASINYANRIQQAILPSDAEFNEYFAEYFILYKPRDIVSGDFYRIYAKNNKIVLVVADCTGHGIPGAFMSLIGSSLLDKIIMDWHTIEPQLILNELHTSIREVLKQRETQNTDGMDIAICTVNTAQRTLSYSGAKSPLVLIQNDTLHLVKGTRHSIGGHEVKKGRTYQAHQFTLDSEAQFYIFSDGFQDQFGGEAGRKFMSKRFRNLMYEYRKLPLQQQKLELSKTLENWIKTGNEKQNDDILVIGIRPFSESFWYSFF